MADLAHDGMYRVVFCDDLEDPSAPTLTEIGQGVHMECRLTPTGLQREPSTERKDTSKLCSTFSTQSAGRRSFNLQVVYVREVGDTTGLEAALTYKAPGYLIVRDDVDAATAWAQGDDCEVYPVQCDQPAKATPAANEDQQVTVGFAMTGEPELEAVVAT